MKPTRRQRLAALQRQAYQISPTDPRWLWIRLEIENIKSAIAETKALNEAEAEYEEMQRELDEQADREYVPMDEDIYGPPTPEEVETRIQQRIQEDKEERLFGEQEDISRIFKGEGECGGYDPGVAWNKLDDERKKTQ